MKKVVLLALSASLLFSVEFDFQKKIEERALEKSFTNYWEARGAKKFYKTYDYELPYLNYLHSQEWYEDFFSRAMRIKKMVVKKVKCKEEKCRIEFNFYTKSAPKESHYLQDDWINVDGKWYHVYNDNPLPGF